MKHSDYDCNLGCPVEATLNTIGGKWKGVILYHLLAKTHRFNELRRLMPDVTQRMLTKQLRELEADNLIIRTVYPEIPPKVEYSMSAYGETLVPVIHALREWGIRHLEGLESKEREGA
ncbi:winged helix-turn-helix transcriptional regulator [Litoribrevibacter albus]|uniref:Transcriptional regulator n=1 Tax=Litoribrevibacter albus TaxID=1473156 RepID=A0AA37S7X7_9GAMM|nr:helix-turn-helix domain-containing protein [Litoribrevibacter albus]GLQ29598.1 transcriptional regulator [Litoribrevibacter albus]